ncbi:hypothetical protein LTSEHVI_0623 [Salmonella enterica subsp. enterica serovar Hvittingfoss str. A4-620]|nr:hypothetical protein LTSEHVI_0623 [Salmonella enterica subsp. enterica serovar Hvittingfoss str. A4-620]
MPSIRLADLAEQLDAELHGDGDIVIAVVAATQVWRYRHHRRCVHAICNNRPHYVYGES